jgi:predicted unusual protein kinase regulating ubiquinone biosynthesis (AarF/ABC1/UbiB family)
MSKRRSSRVPTGRLERLARLGLMAGEFAAGGLAEGARRLVGASASTSNPFMTGAGALRLAKRLSRMRGAAMKLGQLLSMQGEELVPPEFAAALAMLRGSGDTMTVEQLKRVLGREYGRGWESKFSRFDYEPLASASIGEVHSARAADGREIALKIQFPGVAKSIDSDIDSLATLLQVTRVLPVTIDTKGIVQEAKRQLKAEADYLEEAVSLKRYRKLVEKSEPDCVVPRVYDDLTTGRILAMERVEGMPLEQFATEGSRTLRDRTGTTLLRLTLRELFDFRFVQTDPNFANYLVDPKTGGITLLDLGSAREYEPELIEGFRHILAAGDRRDRDAILKAALELGFLDGNEPESRVAAFLDICLLISEPMHAAQPFDFGASDLATRLHAARFELILKHGYVRAPPARLLFLLRKLAGTYLLCGRLGARVNVPGVIRPFLAHA